MQISETKRVRIVLLINIERREAGVLTLCHSSKKTLFAATTLVMAALPMAALPMKPLKIMRATSAPVSV